LDDPTAVEDQDVVGSQHGREAMRDGQDGMASGKGLDSAGETVFQLRV
jgi:hypothetical protein